MLSQSEILDGRNIIYSDGGTCLTLSTVATRLNNERYDVLTIPNKKGANRRARYGRSEDQTAYRRAREIFKEAKKKGSESILDRLQNRESYGNAQVCVGWTEDFRKRVDAIAAGDHSYIAT